MPPISNPHKGLDPQYSASVSAKAAFPHSLEYANFGLAQVVTSEGVYDWSAVETILDTITSDGCQAVIRPIIDRASNPTQIPQYLLDGGLWTTQYQAPAYTLSLHPDYTNSALRACLTNFIAAFGAEYDGDPRIYLVHMGIIAPWGEWDVGSWPLLLNHWVPLETMDEVYTAYTNAFTQTKIAVRYPVGTNGVYTDKIEPNLAVYRNNGLPIGYHDDAFASKTLPTNWTAISSANEYYYWLRMHLNSGTSNNWKSYPFGGEMYYSRSLVIFSNLPPVGIQTFSNCVHATHASYMGASSMLSTNIYGDEFNLETLRDAQMLGYEFYTKSATLTTNATTLRVSVTLTNTGVAPFYYPWQVQVGAVQGGAITKSWDVPWDIRTIIPGDGDITFTADLANPPAGDFKVAMKVVQPMVGGHELKFANTEQDDDVANWLTLGEPNSKGRATVTTLIIGPGGMRGP